MFQIKIDRGRHKPQRKDEIVVEFAESGDAVFRRNENDLEEVPQEVRDQVRFHFVDETLEALREAIPSIAQGA